MNKVKGFTFTEAIAVLAIAAILTGVGVPSFLELKARHQSRQVVFDIIASINTARTHAITTGAVVTMCPLEANNTCGKIWSNGVLTFEDKDGNGKRESGERVLRTLGALSNGDSLSWSSPSKFYIKFAPTGSTRMGNGTFTYCPVSRDARYANQIVLNYSGRVRTAQDLDGDGVKEKSDGKPINCS